MADWLATGSPRYYRSPMLAGLPEVVHGFFTRQGGASTGAYHSLNVSLAVGDDPARVAAKPCSLFPSRPRSRLSRRRRCSGAGDGNRTRVASLEGWSSTIELHPPITHPLRQQESLVEGVGFEPT